MNRETTDKIIVYARNTEVDNNKIHKVHFVRLRPLYVMHYLEECSGSGRVILSSVVNKNFPHQWLQHN